MAFVRTVKVASDVIAAAQSLPESLPIFMKRGCIDSPASEMQLAKSLNGYLLLKTISKWKIKNVYIREYH